MNGSITKILIGVIATGMIAWIGSIQNQVLSFRTGQSRAEVSRQIMVEAPWNKERTYVLSLLRQLDRRLTLDENRGSKNSDRLIRAEVSVAQIQALNRFFCRTRAPTLPSC